MAAPVMSTAGVPPPLVRPSVFISYASEDRAAARELRDALSAAGIDVWYDENELVGGDAWDQKIRRQLRECDYFMPLISATTERRKEGYFRREWRLAAERTMDMADDVLFLLPVVIDGTSEASARVPEKFTAVQWLRVPAGRPNAAIDGLIQRLLAGDHRPLSRPPMLGRTVAATAAAPTGAAAPAPAPARAEDDARPPPMPPFPHAPEKGGVGAWAKFIAEIVWWLVSAAWLVIGKLPKWLRIVLAVWLVFTLIGTCKNRDSDRDPRPREPKASEPKAGDPNPVSEADVQKAIQSATEMVRATLGKTAADGSWSTWAKSVIDQLTPGKPLLLVPFGGDLEAPDATRFAAAAFAACNDRLQSTRRDQVAVTVAPPAQEAEDGLANLGRSLRATHVLAARIAREGETRVLVVRLLRAADGSLAWSQSYPIDPDKAEAVGRTIAEAVLGIVPARATQ